MIARITCLAIGYVCGLIQTGYLFGKAHHVDIREHGSGNSGATNSLRVLGVKAGIIVLLGDFLKCFIPCMVIRYIFRGQIGIEYVLMLYMGLGVCLGHNFPFYLKFKGGKGVASTAGVIVAMNLRITLVCLILFIAIVAITRYVSLASICVMLIFFSMTYIFSHTGIYNLGAYTLEFNIMCAVVAGLSIYRHRANIIRLIHGNENKIGKKA